MPYCSAGVTMNLISAAKGVQPEVSWFLLHQHHSTSDNLVVWSLEIRIGIPPK